MSYNPQDSIHKTVFVVFDLETTGLDFDSHNIIEIGAAKTNSNEVIETFQSFIKIEGSIPAEASAVNGITDDMLHDAPPAKEVLQSFLHFLGDCVLVAHNITFDYRFLNAELIRNGFVGVENNLLIDTLELSRKSLKNLSRFSLEAITNHLGIAVDTRHRALDDALACREVLFHCCNNISMLGELSLSEIII